MIRREEASTAAGERVLVRSPGRNDLPAFLDLVRRSARRHRGLVEPPTSVEGFHAYLARIARPTHEGFLVCLRDSGRIAGVVNLNEIVRGVFMSATVGFYADVELEGHGLMSEGLGLVVSHAFGPLALHRLEANVQPSNERSIRLIERLGFAREGFSPRYLRIGGRWRDHERYALLAERWRSARDGTTTIPTR